MKNYRVLPLLLVTCLLQACAAGAVVDVVAETVEAGVELTGAVVKTAVDIVVPDGDDDEED